MMDHRPSCRRCGVAPTKEHFDNIDIEVSEDCEKIDFTFECPECEWPNVAVFTFEETLKAY